MSLGERAALEGLLSQCKPHLAIELGTAQGGSLERIAAHSDEVHTFDLLEPPVDRTAFPNVHFHIGDSHELLPALLADLAQTKRKIDFALIDGDHSPEGVRADLEDLLRSPALAQGTVVLHDTMNESVRKGIQGVRFEAYPKVAYVELDFVAGYMFREQSLRHQLWGGLGLVLVDASRIAYFQESIRQARYYEAFDLIREIREIIVARESQRSDAAVRRP